MTTAQIIAQMRRKSGSDTSQYPDADALIDLNTLKDEFWSAICTTVNEDYNWERWTSSSVALQSEYTLATVAYNTAWTKILKWVAVNYNWETYTDTGWLIYLKARLVNPNTLPYEWDYYVENQSEDDPIYYIADNSYFIAPAPRTVVTNWLKLTWIRKIPDYTLSTTEADTKLPVDVHNALVYWLVVQALENKRVEENLIISAENRRTRKRQEAIQSLETRVEWPIFMKYPDEVSDEITFN